MYWTGLHADGLGELWIACGDQVTEPLSHTLNVWLNGIYRPSIMPLMQKLCTQSLY